MSIIAWIVLGLIAGFIAAKIVNKRGTGFFLNIVLGIVGAVVGGEIFTALGESRVTGFNLYSLVVSVIGAIIILVILPRDWRATGPVNRRDRGAPALGACEPENAVRSTRRWREPDSNHRSRSCERSLGCCRREMPDR